MSLAITPIYAALIALLYLWLAYRVIIYRRANRLSVGDEGDRQLAILMRAHANCAEYAPMGLILLALAELQGAPAIAVHLLGVMLFSGRALHGIGFGRNPNAMGPRVGGMILTLVMIAVTALGLLAHGLLPG